MGSEFASFIKEIRRLEKIIVELKAENLALYTASIKLASFNWEYFEIMSKANSKTIYMVDNRVK